MGAEISSISACCGPRDRAQQQLDGPRGEIEADGGGGGGFLEDPKGGGSLFAVGDMFGAKKEKPRKAGVLVLSQPAFQGDMDAVRNKCSPDLKKEMDVDKNTPVHWAAVKGHRDIVEFLLKNDFLATSPNNDGDTPLHWAASGGHHDVVKLLLDGKADPWSRNTDHTTPLHFACAEGKYEVVTQLVALAGPAPQSDGGKKKSKKGQADEKLRFPLNFVTKDNDAPLHWAAASGEASVVATLVSKGADCNMQNNDGNTPLHVACAEGAYDVVNTLLRNGRADISIANDDMETPLHWACSGSHRDILALLLESKADAHAKNKFDEQPIHFAVQKGDIAMVEILAEHGASPDATTKMKDSCLHLAVTRCDVQMISKLIALGANLNSKNKLGDSVLHSACSIGDLSTVQQMLEQDEGVRADVNALNDEQESPLHWAAASGHPVIVRYLLKMGAKKEVQNSKNRTPKDLASDVQTLSAF